ncbi:MAG: sporulation transcription factor Spo0A [Acutalibacteraceae bacterium]|nr:sporulation transcription factor Spo0A [Acutalibacteraceae bacterium]
MTKNLKIIIADETKELGQSYVKIFKAYGIDVVLCEKDGVKVLDKTKTEKPDIILADVFMPNLDILGVLKGVNEMEQDDRPVVMAMSAFDNQWLEKEMLNAGAGYYFLKPFDVNTLAERIIQLSHWQYENEPVAVKCETVSDNKLEIMITKIIREIGIPANIKGYHYLRTAIKLAVKNSEIMNSVTKLLYPTVAKNHNSTSSRVERAIRHAIEKAWEREDAKAIDTYFGYIPHCTANKPSNSEFIAVISDRLRLKIRI